jgi:hypothetical protein
MLGKQKQDHIERVEDEYFSSSHLEQWRGRR